MVLLGQCQYVLERAGHHDRLMSIRVEGEACKGAAGLHAQGALVGACFAGDFDQDVDALVSEGTRQIIRRETVRWGARGDRWGYEKL